MLYISKSWYVNKDNEKTVQELFKKYCSTDVLTTEEINEQKHIEVVLQDIGEIKILELYKSGKLVV